MLLYLVPVLDHNLSIYLHRNIEPSFEQGYRYNVLMCHLTVCLQYYHMFMAKVLCEDVVGTLIIVAHLFRRSETEEER